MPCPRPAASSRLFLWFLLLLPGLVPGAAIAGEAPSAEPTVVIVVRHAEKVVGTDDADPPLTAAGRERAELLARTLADAGIDAVYSTPLRRTRATARPTAEALGLDVRVVKPDPDHPQRLARILRAEHAGSTVLVVGHSNTVPPILRALGADGVPDLDESEYDDLFVAVLDADGARLVHLHYGRPTP